MLKKRYGEHLGVQACACPCECYSVGTELSFQKPTGEVNGSQGTLHTVTFSSVSEQDGFSNVKNSNPLKARPCAVTYSQPGGGKFRHF